MDKKPTIEIVSKAKKILIEASKDLKKYVLDKAAKELHQEFQSINKQEAYKEAPQLGVIAASGDGVKPFKYIEDLSAVGVFEPKTLVPIGPSIKTWASMNKKGPLSLAIKEKVASFNGMEDVYIQVDAVTSAQKLKNTVMLKKHVNDIGMAEVNKMAEGIVKETLRKTQAQKTFNDLTMAIGMPDDERKKWRKAYDMQAAEKNKTADPVVKQKIEEKFHDDMQIAVVKSLIEKRLKKIFSFK